jgi:hypothetical protein
MKKEKLLELINTASNELDDFEGSGGKFTACELHIIISIRFLLGLLNHEALNNSQEINIRVLRATIDIAGLLAKQHEDAWFAESFFRITDFFYSEIPIYRQLNQLGMDYGKGHPV